LVIRKTRSASLECESQPVLGLAVVVFPAVVEERDACVDRLVDQSDGVVPGCKVAEVMSADSDGRHLDAGATQKAPRNGARVRLIRHHRDLRDA
jgi:hypothetical protein